MKKIIFLFIFLSTLAGCGSIPQEPLKTENSSPEISQNTDQTPKEEVGEKEDIFSTPQEDTFKEIDVAWKHTFSKNTSHPIMGAALGDFDNDGAQEVFIGGGYNQSDIILRIDDENNSTIRKLTKNQEASYGSYTLDYDIDGDVDIFVARESGLYVYINEEGNFTSRLFWGDFPKDAIPLDIDFGDIDNDGDADVFISTFIRPSLFSLVTFNKDDHKQANILLENMGDGTYQNVSKKWGIAQKDNTFTSAFGDIDNDGKLDLVIAPNTGKLAIYKNIGDRFEKKYESDYGFWMGLALSDINHDGKLDIFVSNTGDSIPERILRGDLTSSQKLTTDFLFLIQEENFAFTNIYSDSIGFGWGITPINLQGDKSIELSISQNNIKWPPHKLSKLSGEILTYNTTLQTLDTEKKLENKKYGMSTLYGDINGDMLEDIVYINLDDAPRVLLQEKDSAQRIISLDTKGNPKYLHGNIQINFENGNQENFLYNPKQGLLSKQSQNIVYRYNHIESYPEQIQIQTLSGEAINISLESILQQSPVLQ